MNNDKLKLRAKIKVTTQNRIVLPKQVTKLLNININDELFLDVVENMIIIRREENESI